MRAPVLHACSLAFIAALATGCASTAPLQYTGDIGANPALPAPDTSLIPTVHIAPAKGWPSGVTPIAAPGLSVRAFASGLNHPRWLYVLPNGDVLVAESNGPERPQDSQGIRGWVMKLVMKIAGAGVASADRITLLRDADGDGIAELRQPFLEGLHSPFGMALVGNDFYVADTDKLLRFDYAPNATHLSGPGIKLTDLPGGPINHHWTKNVLASPDGTKLYVTIGSNSNVAENGIEAEAGRAAIWEVDAKTGSHRIYASGLRNPNGLAWEGAALWTVVNERDELGSMLVPDYLTSVRDGGFYGWPYSYYGAHVDQRVKPPRPDLVAKAIAPDFALGSHVAPLGLVSANGTSLPARFSQGMFVGEHGSWNRKPLSGYKVVYVPFNGGKPAGMPVDVLSGFVNAAGDAYGRPVGVALDKRGALLVADDVGNIVWRVSAAP